MKVNNQKPQRKNKDPYNLQVHSIWETIQGEGPFAGTPAIFVRLAGCNLQCPLCDTDYTSNIQVLSPESIANAVMELGCPSGLVVLTGGEPFRQDLSELLKSLHRASLRVQIESNGAMHPGFDLDDFSTYSPVIVVSPKTSFGNLEIRRRAIAYKYILEAGRVCTDDGLPLESLANGPVPIRPPEGMSKSNIYVQPLDEQDEEKNKAHIEAAVASCLQFGYRLCLQTHKIIGLP